MINWRDEIRMIATTFGYVALAIACGCIIAWAMLMVIGML